MSEVTEDTGTEEKTLLGGDEDAGKVSRDTDSKEGDTEVTKTEESSKTDESEKKDESSKTEEKAGAPESYSDFKIPEGFEIDQERMSLFQEFGKEHGLTQDAAQNLVDLHVKAIEGVTEAQAAEWATIKEGWVSEVRADKELQDEDGKADAAIAVAAKAVKALGGDKLQEALNLTGAGSHPAVVKAFHEIGKHMEDDRLVFGSGGDSETKTGPSALYPTMKQ